MEENMGRGQPRRAWAGVYAAIPTPFTNDYELDLDALAGYLGWLVGHPSLAGIVCGAHAGEVTNLTPDEMVAVARCCVEAVHGRVRVVAGLFAEGVRPALEMAERLEETGIDALMVMPPHHWLRFGKTLDAAVSYVGGIAAGTQTDLIIHEYPIETLAGYTTEEIVALARIPKVVAIKSGTREMSQYAAHIHALRREAPHVAVLTCHDEAMLPTMVQGVDGMLVAIASLIPDELSAMCQALEDGDLAGARRIEKQIAPIMDLLYGSGQPGGHAHALLKAALHLLGKLPGFAVRSPVPPVEHEELVALGEALRASRLLGSPAGSGVGAR